MKSPTNRRILFNILLGLTILTVLFSIQAHAQTEEAVTSDAKTYNAVGAALAVGLAGIGAGYAVGIAGASGISALTEKPELFSNVLLIVALGEGIAIYGLIVAILILLL